MHIYGFPVALAAIAGAIAVLLWSYRKLHRITAWLFGLAAFLLATGLTPWTDALASLIRTGTGITALIIVLLAGGLGFHFEAILKHQHHRIRTPVIAVVFGTALLLAIASIRRLLSEAAKSPAQAGHAIAISVGRIKSGQAAHAVSAHGHGYPALAIAAAALAALVLLGRKMDKRGRKMDKRGRGRGAVPAVPAALPAGRGRPALPRGR